MNYAAHTLDKIFYVLELDVDRIFAVGNNFYTDNNIEASALILLKLSDGTSAAFTYCGCSVIPQYETYFYFTNGVAKIIETKLYISYNGEKFEEVELNYEKDVFEVQLAEFIKLVKGEDNQLVTPEYIRKVIEVIDGV